MKYQSLPIISLHKDFCLSIISQKKVKKIKLLNIASKMKKKSSTREVGFHLSLKLKKRCIVGKKRATEVS